MRFHSKYCETWSNMFLIISNSKRAAPRVAHSPKSLEKILFRSITPLQKPLLVLPIVARVISRAAPCHGVFEAYSSSESTPFVTMGFRKKGRKQWSHAKRDAWKEERKERLTERRAEREGGRKRKEERTHQLR